MRVLCIALVVAILGFAPATVRAQCVFPGTPTGLTWSSRAGSLQLVWVPPARGPATRWTILAGSSPGGSDILSQTIEDPRSWTSLILPAGVFYVRVLASNDCGTSDTSPEVRVDTMASAPPAIVLQEIGPFIELRNVGSTSVNLGGWRLYGSSGREQLVADGARIDDLTFLRPGCSLLLGDTLLETGVPVEFRVPALFGFSTSLALARGDGRIVDQVGREPGEETIYRPPFGEGVLLASFASVPLDENRSYNRTAGDTDDNRTDFALSSPPTPRNLGGCQSVPVAPSNLAATTSGTTVTLSWRWASGGVDIAGFQLEAGSAAGSADRAVFLIPPGLRTMTFSGVPSGIYYVRLRSFNSTSQSASSNELTLVVCPAAGCGVLPGPVTQLSFQVNGSSVRLMWRAPTSGATPSRYVIEAGTAPGLANRARFPTGSASEFVMVTGVPTGVYYVRVRAESGGLLGLPSNEVLIVVQ